MNQIAAALTRLFERHRIVVWRDEKRELAADFAALDLPGVEKIAVGNDEFGVKHRILREQPTANFLLYCQGEQPSDTDNWLLYVELAYTTFRADQIDLWLAELGLGAEFRPFIKPHEAFFRSAQRRAALQAALAAGDTPRAITLKMLAVCAGAEPLLDEILEALLDELAAGKDARAALIAECGLDKLLWGEVERNLGYTSAACGIHDFAITLFQAGYAAGLGQPPSLKPDALVFLKRWKDSTSHREAFDALSARAAEILNIASDLADRDWRRLVDLDLFELVDQKIISDLARGVAAQTVRPGECDDVLGKRRRTHWYAQFEDLYETLVAAARFNETLKATDLTVPDFAGGFERYWRTWYRLDQLYRHVLAHARRAGQRTVLKGVLDLMENQYTNHFLLPLNNAWQQHAVDPAETWGSPQVPTQAAFFEKYVRPFGRRDNKVCVVISDGLRYEVGEELLRLIRQEDRYEATLDAVLSVLPSYTPLGMAALLPHETLGLSEDGMGTALVDDASTQGAEYRRKALARAVGEGAQVIGAEELLRLDKETSRALFRAHDVVYVYHNRIDKTGDNRDSEERTFEAAGEALEELVRIVKKLANANASNIIVTADHGFIYQDRKLADSDFLSQEPAGDDIEARNRRFVVGHGLKQSSAFKHFTAAQLGLAGSHEFLFPKSINRLRVQGSGARYVHGGVSLQEVVLPVLQINKKRQGDVTKVKVEFIGAGSATITTGQLAVVFYQREPVTEKVQPRTLRAGIYTEAGQLISDRHDLVFDLTSPNERDRERRVRFVLTQAADAANGQTVFVKLEEPVPGTTHYQPYDSRPYVLRRSFTKDFDF
jgi:uncharacterized protein (TIGR02687 family)